MSDIQEHGYYNYRDLQLANNEKYLPTLDMSGWEQLSKLSGKQLGEAFKGTYSEPIGLKLASAGYGNSVYDENAVSDWDLANLNEVRAVNQSGLLLLGNGILKMGTTGVTTFLDGTVGLLYGLGTGGFNALGINGKNKDGTDKTFIQGLWDNDFNKAMSNILDTMEEVAPNYYSLAELNNPWYTNILSANFLGDKVLKNMGFTIGALGAMYVTGGSGIAGLMGKGALAAAKFTLGNAGKLLGASRGTLAGINNFARGTGQLAHNLVLTAIGASGEASIEAINAVKEGSKDAYRNLEIRRQELIDALDPESPDYYQNLEAIDAATEQYKLEIDSKFRDAGNSVYAANMAILSVSNALQFAPLIKGGFQRSAKLADFERRLGDRVVGANEWAQGILRGESASIANTVNKGYGRIAAKAFGNSLVEGSEEASQNLASNSRQLQAKARLNKEAEDTLLGARINPEATLELVDYTKAFSKALYDNFGRPESKGWEEFFLGALTGGIGFIGIGPHDVKNDSGELMYDPITHKKVTSWKPRSISDWFLGGIMEAARDINREYDENQIIVDAVNQKLSDPEFIKRTQHAIGDKDFANKMDAALLENDMFKFKNSEIGKLVNDVFFFREKGMIDEYKSIFQGLTNIDDKTLQQLYTATADPEGNTELAQEDMEAVRNEYQEKAKSNLEKIKMIQDYYDFVDLEYRDRSPLFKEELAYQYIRLDDTRRRILELEEKKKSPSKFKASLLGLMDYANNPDEWDGSTPSRDAYIASIENNNGLTESEQKDLERLKRLEKVYQHRIDKAKNNPAWIDLQHNLAYSRAKRDYDSKDVESLITQLKQANSVSEIDLIIANADQSIKQEIINRAYSEGDEELLTKLKSQISASTAYTQSKKRLDKIWEKEDAKELNDAMSNLLYLVYMSNNMDLNEVKKSLQQIYDELLEDSVDTISRMLPYSYEIFENFLGEEAKQEKGIFSDVLEGAIEDVGNGIINGELWKVLRETANRAKKQLAEAEAKSKQQEEKKKKKVQSSDLAIQNSTYVKNIPNLDAYKKEIEDFGIEELDNIIRESLEGTGYEDDTNAINNAIKFATSIVVRGKGRLDELKSKHKGTNPVLDNLFSIFDKRYKTASPSNKKSTPSGNSFKDLLKQIKLADKNGDAATVLKIVNQISDNAITYMQEGAKSSDMDYILELEKKYKNKKPAVTSSEEESTEEHLDGEVTSETTEKDGVKTTKFTWWKQSKKTGKVVPTIGGGLSINTEDIDEDSIDTEEIEKVILTELREKDGKFAGTIMYSFKGEKDRMKGEVKFKQNPTKKDESNSALTYIDRMNKAKTLEENDKAANDAAKAGIPESEWLGAYHRNENRIAKSDEGKGDTVGGSPVALSYLLENGPGTIKSTGYLLHAISAAFEANTKDIEDIRSKYLEQLDDNPENFKNDKTGALREIKDIINFTYGKEGISILNEILENATGFYAKEGNKIASRLEALKALMEDLDEDDMEIETEEEQSEVVVASDVPTLILLNKFYSTMHIDPNTLSVLEQQLILSNLEKTIDLVKENKEIPVELQAYATVILDNNTNGTVISEIEQKIAFPEASAANAEELNGAFRGLYEVGNSSTGTPNLLQLMVAERASTSSLEANYGTVLHAELVQWCIDNILKDLKDAEIPVKVIAVVGQTYANGKPNITLYTAVKADAKVGPKKNKTVKDIAKSRWLQETNDGEYIIIGTLGYNGSSLEQAANWTSIREDINTLIANAGVTEGYFVSSNEKHTFKINDIGEGRPARTHYQHTSSNSIVELIEGTDRGRNPHGLTLRDLKWQIVYTDEAKSVNVEKGDRIRGKANLGLGKVYVLIPTPSGSYYRHPVNPVTIDEANKDSKLYKKVDALIEKIIKDKKVEDIIALKGWLVLEKESEDLSFLDIYFNDAGTRVQYIPNKVLGSLTSVTLSEDEDEAIDQLKDIIYNQIRPFISVTLGHLSSPSSIRMLDEAGALQLKGDLAMFSYVGANYTVIPYNSATNSKPGPRVRSSLQSNELELRYNGQQIFRRGNDYYRNEELITDPREIEILNDISAINDGQYNGESLWEWRLRGKGKNKEWIQKPIEGEYYFIQKGTSITIYHKDVRGNITKITQDKVNKLLNIRAKVLSYNTDKAIEEAIKSGEAVAEEDIDIAIDEEDSALAKKDKKQETLSGNTEEIEVPTITGGIRKIKAEKVQYSDLKNGDLVWYSGPETATPINKITVEGIDNGEVYDSNGVLPKNRTYYREVKQDSSKANMSGKSIYQEIMDNEEGSGGLTANFRTLERSAEKGDITVEEALTFVKNRVKDIKYSDSQLRDALEYLINKKAPRNEERRQRSLEKAEKELGLHKGDVIEDSRHRRYTVLGYTWSNSSMEGSKELFNDNDYLEGEPSILLQSTSGDVESMPAGLMYINWKERRITSYTKIDPTVESRKQDAIKRATYDLELLKELKVGDTIALPSDTLPNYKTVITNIEFSEIDDIEDAYSYSDISGTVVITYIDDGLEYTMPISEILANDKYKKINKQSQKSLKGLNTSENNSTFVARLLDSKLDTLALEDALYDKASSIAKTKGIEFDEDCSIKELVKWYKENAKFDLNSIPSNAELETVLEIIENCK